MWRAFVRHWLCRRIIRVDSRLVLSVAVSLAASNLLINQWVVEQAFSPDHHLGDGARSLLLRYNAGSVALAVLFVLLRNRLGFVIRLYHLGVAWIVAEAVIRVVLFLPGMRVPFIENPILYADPYCNDDYWVLYHYYPGAVFHSARRVDPRYGWTKGSSDQPGVDSRGAPQEASSRASVVVFGDSYLVSGGELGRRIPEVMEELIGGGLVVNYGVSGYGVDQICLRFKDEYPGYRDQRPVVLVGILLEDMDRSLLSFRGCQKPYYEYKEGRLSLQFPRFRSNEEFIERYHFYGKSFVLSAGIQFVRRVLGVEGRPAWREELNRAILADTQDFAKSNDCRLYYVIFYAVNDVLVQSERERSLRVILEDLGIEKILDTKATLQRYIKEHDVDVTALYGSDGHHTSDVNVSIAQDIVRELRREGEIE